MPIPEATSFEDLNQKLLARAFKEDDRRVAREKQTIGEAWEEEREHLLVLPPSDFECCKMTTVRLNPYSQVQFETNRYSVPVNQARKTVTLKAYPFCILLSLPGVSSSDPVAILPSAAPLTRSSVGSRSKENESDESARKRHHKADKRQPVEQIILVLAQMVKGEIQNEYGENTDNSRQDSPSSPLEIALVLFLVHMMVLSSCPCRDFSGGLSDGPPRYLYLSQLSDRERFRVHDSIVVLIVAWHANTGRRQRVQSGSRS